MTGKRPEKGRSRRPRDEGGEAESMRTEDRGRKRLDKGLSTLHLCAHQLPALYSSTGGPSLSLVQGPS